MISGETTTAEKRTCHPIDWAGSAAKCVLPGIRRQGQIHKALNAVSYLGRDATLVKQPTGAK